MAASEQQPLGGSAVGCNTEPCHRYSLAFCALFVLQPDACIVAVMQTWQHAAVCVDLHGCVKHASLMLVWPQLWVATGLGTWTPDPHKSMCQMLSASPLLFKVNTRLHMSSDMHGMCLSELAWHVSVRTCMACVCQDTVICLHCVHMTKHCLQLLSHMSSTAGLSKWQCSEHVRPPWSTLLSDKTETLLLSGLGCIIQLFSAACEQATDKMALCPSDRKPT